MSIYTNPPEWEDAGKKPPSSKRTEGWRPGDRVPASWLNWFWFSTVNSLREIAQAFVSHRESTSGVHGVPEGETIATKRYVDGRVDAAIPVGGIIMWSGSIDSIPPGWALCDGRNGTPDLRDRFIVGAGGSYNVGNTGGSNTVRLNVNQIPAHQHTGETSAGLVGYKYYVGAAVQRASGVYNEYVAQDRYVDFSHSHKFTTDSTGGGQAHENRPPYYALCFIMKL